MSLLRTSSCRKHWLTRITRHSPGGYIVSKDVLSDSFRGETGTLRNGPLDICVEDVGHTVTGEPASSCIWKRNVIREAGDFGKPRT